MFKKLFFTFTILFFFQVNAQFIKKKSIDFSFGYALSTPVEKFDLTDTGFYLQSEYVLSFAKWFDIRPYIGLILIKPDNDQQNAFNYKSITNTFLVGGKTRIKAPIPWVAPYIEFGVGTSIGSFETVTPNTNINNKSVFLHIPFSIGLELSKKHNFNIAFNFYFHNNVEQFSRATVIGFSFSL
jgi:hypothetical protein